MEKVVFILGAGFSAYAGLPLMSNFLSKSKDMYFENIEKYKHFGKIYSNIDKLAKIKNYYNANMFNIEEILSLLEMQQKLGETDSIKKQFIDYIIDVIEYYSPNDIEFTKPSRSSSSWYKEIFGSNERANEYGNFILSLLKAIITPTYQNRFDNLLIQSEDILTTDYKIITFNYDMIIEDYLKYINLTMDTMETQDIPIYKLHGCISKRNIIPPTWAKSIDKSMIGTWKSAFSALVEATQIRIIGYSLPISDSYFRYFLKSTIIRNNNLKAIDIICYDPSNTVISNYKEFIVFDQCRFQNKCVEDYLREIKDSLPYHTSVQNKSAFSYRFYERNHNLFMNKGNT